MATVLITGAAGFLGSHMTETFVREGFNVFAVDNMRTGKEENIKQVGSDGSFKFYRVDIRSEKVFNLIKEADYIIHLAAIVNIQDFYERPKEGFDINVMGTVNLLEAARKYDVELFEFASSAAVYGNPARVPIREEDPMNPIHPYGASKLAGEKIGMTYLSTYGLRFLAFRIFNIYGPRMPGGFYSGVIAKFIKQALKGESLTIYGSGEQTRDFIFVSDVVRGFLAGIKRRGKGVYNLGTGKAISINELAKLILKLTNSKSGIIWTDPRPGDIHQSQACIDKARAELGWEPKVEIESGLRITIEWYKGRFS